MRPRHAPDRVQRIERRDGRRARRRHDRTRLSACRPIFANHRLQRVGTHRVGGVVRHDAQVLTTEPGQQHRLLDGAVAVCRRVDDKRRGLGLQPASREPIVRGALARQDERDHRARRRGVLNHAPPGRRQAQHLAHPVGHHLFEFRQRRTRLP
jgi:hypothetical protein